MTTPQRDQWEASRERIAAARNANQARAFDRAMQRDTVDRDEVFTRFLGQLVREGKTVFYINLRNGKTKEGNPTELIDYLIRNNYV